MDITNITGHRFILDKGAKTLTIMNPGTGQKLTLDEAKGTISISDAAGDSFILDAQQKKMTIDFKGDIVISSAGNITLGGDAAKALVTEALLSLFNDHVHTVPSYGTTDKPTPQITKADCLTTKVKGA